jgi:steroid Delta-isomerase
MSSTTAATLQRYAAWLDGITPDTLEELRSFTIPEVHFKDPFNDVRGQDMMLKAFADVFERGEEVRFAVRDVASGEGVGFILWDFTFRPKRSRKVWEFRGVSEVRVDAAGRVTEHVDHFDAGSQLYARLPVVGPLVRLVRRRLQVKD